MSQTQKQLEENVLSSINSPNDLSKIIIEGITSEYFVVYKDQFKFIQKYHSKYGNIPSRKILVANYPDLVLQEEVKEDEQDYSITELIKSNMQREAVRILNTGAELVTQDIYGGIDFLVSKLNQIRKADKKYSISFTDRDALQRYDEFIERQDKLAKGLKLGLRTGFSLFDDNNIGWQPGNLVGIVGRPNIGKSFLLQYCACSAYSDGHRIVYLSPEMSINEMNLRFDTMMSAFYNYKFPNDELILSKVDKDKYKEWLTQLSKNSRWVTMDSNHGKPFTLAVIDSIADEFQPDLLAIDSFLALRSTETVIDKNWQTMLDVAHGLKAIAQNKKIVIIVTSQVKRMSFEELEAKDGMPDLDNVYGGDALGQAADLMVAMSSDAKDDTVRYITVPKRRTGGKREMKKIKLAFEVNVGRIAQ